MLLRPCRLPFACYLGVAFHFLEKGCGRKPPGNTRADRNTSFNGDCSVVEYEPSHVICALAMNVPRGTLTNTGGGLSPKTRSAGSPGGAKKLVFLLVPGWLRI